MLTLKQLLNLQANPELLIYQTELDAEAQLHLVNEITRSVEESTASGLLVWIALAGVLISKFHHIDLTGERTGTNVQFKVHMEDGAFSVFTMGDEVKLVEDLQANPATGVIA